MLVVKHSNRAMHRYTGGYAKGNSEALFRDSWIHGTGEIKKLFDEYHRKMKQCNELKNSIHKLVKMAKDEAKSRRR